jgi:hypothetical protein
LVQLGVVCDLEQRPNGEEKGSVQVSFKAEDKTFYLQAKKVLSTDMLEEALRDLHHGFHSNTCESQNGFITKAVL